MSHQIELKLNLTTETSNDIKLDDNKIEWSSIRVTASTRVKINTLVNILNYSNSDEVVDEMIELFVNEKLTNSQQNKFKVFIEE